MLKRRTPPSSPTWHSPSHAKPLNPIRLIRFLSFIGAAVSLYLLFEHYAPATSGDGKRFCDVSGMISCSAVNKSQYAFILNVPVALYGFNWFLIAIVTTIKIQNGNGRLVLPLFCWSVIGVLFVVYFLFIEFRLQAICPLCTVIHFLVVVLCWASFKLLVKNSASGVIEHPFSSHNSIPTHIIINPATTSSTTTTSATSSPTTTTTALTTTTTTTIEKFRKCFSSSVKWWMFGVLMLNLFPVILLNFVFPQYNSGLIIDVNVQTLAHCIRDHGVEMYGSNACPVCIRQKALFGENFEFIKFYDCRTQEGEGPCSNAKITRYPTWVRMNISDPTRPILETLIGYRSLVELASFAGCVSQSLAPPEVTN